MVGIKPKSLIFLVFLFSFVLVSSAPPIQTNLNYDVGLQIFYPDFSNIKQDTSFNLNIHVTNITTGKIIDTSGVNCTLDLYNSTGYQQFEGNLTPQETLGDYSLFIDGTNFSNLGLMAWRIYCGDGVGGTVSGVIDISNTGVALTGPISSLMIFLLILYVGLFLISIYGYTKLPKGNVRGEEGKIIKISYLKYLSIFVGGCVYLFGFLILNLAGSIGISYLPNAFAGQMLFNLSLFMGYLGIPLILLALFRVIESVLDDRELKRLMDRGIDIDGEGY